MDILAQGAAVLSRRQPMEGQARSTTLDVTEFVIGELEKFKGYTVHTADLKDCQIYPDQLDIQHFGIIPQHGSGAVKIYGNQLGSSRR
jgi:hypothetical protein